MEAPTLVLVPSSPITHTPSSATPSPALSSKDNSPVSSDSSHTTPPSSYGVSAPEDSTTTRNSSESTIFSIYSMYSERRQTWSKVPPPGVSAGVGGGASIPNSSSPPGANYPKDRQSQSHYKKQSGDTSFPTIAEDGTGTGRAGSPYGSGVSRQSSNGSSHFFAGSDTASQHAGYYSPGQSRPASRTRSALLDVAAHSRASLSGGVGVHSGVATTANGRPSSELAYPNSSSRNSSPTVVGSGSDKFTSTSTSTSAAVSAAFAPTPPMRAVGQPIPIPRRANFMDLPSASLIIDEEEVPGLGSGTGSSKHQMRPYSGSPSPGRPGRMNMNDDVLRASTIIITDSPHPNPAGTVRESSTTSRSSSHSHWKNDSASTTGGSGHVVGLGFSGLDNASTTHEGYVTAPQSIESSALAHSPPRILSAASSQRFRVMNPSPPQSPSPPPPPPPSAFPPQISPAVSAAGSSSRRSTVSSINKALPPRPRTSPSEAPSVSSMRRQSLVSVPSSSPKRPASAGRATGSESVTQAEGEESEAYFVRNTYALLDLTGVRGDGYEEGIERTRAKLGHDRRSVQLAVKNDAKEDSFGEIPQKELDILKNVDRYGFFNTPSHERLILLPSSAFSKPLHPITQVDPTVPPTPSFLRSLPTPRPTSKSRSTEARRIAKWDRMLVAERRDKGGNVSVWGVRVGKKEKKLRRRVFKGVPDRWRGAAWEVLAARWKAGRQRGGIGSGRGVNPAEREREMERLKEVYRDGLERPSSYDVQIDLDVPRTINGHVLFKTRYGQGQRALFHTLHSFSLACSECGYCQGMGPLAATLLCYYEPEKVYAMLVQFHDADVYQMHDIFLPGFPGLLEAIYIQERVMERMMPVVFASFKKHMISTTSYATKWYITLFANSVPFQTQLRLWDAFLLEGRDVFILAAVAIVWVLRDHLTSPQANFETVLSLLSSFFVPEDEDALMKWIERAVEDKKLRADMVRWRQDWKQLVREKKDGSALL